LTLKMKGNPTLPVPTQYKEQKGIKSSPKPGATRLRKKLQKRIERVLQILLEAITAPNIKKRLSENRKRKKTADPPSYGPTFSKEGKRTFGFQSIVEPRKEESGSPS